MKLPATFTRLLGTEPAIEKASDDALVYPPVGFFQWPFGGLGNGDEFGYYWPVGREAADPVVVMMSHDCWALIPVASSLERLAATGGDAEIAALLKGEPFEPADDDLESDASNELSLSERLALDDQSPYLLVASADLAATANELDRAVSLYRQAISILPEYTAAHFGLALAYRRQRSPDLAAASMLDAIRSPLCFQGASFWAETALTAIKREGFRRKCLLWLQQARIEDTQRLADDPLFQARQRLSFATGVKENGDFAIYDHAVDDYAARGRTLEAIRLLMLVGELMMSETVSFRDRYGFTPSTFRERLLVLCRLAELERVAFLE